MKILFSKICSTKLNISQWSGMQNNPSLSMSTMWSCSICTPCFFPFSLALPLREFPEGILCTWCLLHGLLKVLAPSTQRVPGSIPLFCTPFHGKELMQITVTDKTHPGDIMISLKTFQHKGRMFLPSLPPRTVAAGAPSCCFCRREPGEAPPCSCWSHPAAYFQTAKISSSCYSPGWSSLF